ncbi:hypothetical protein C0995_001724, partial [Termitomyces sp. Mi166
DHGKLFTALHAENLTTGYSSVISGSGTLDLAVPHDIQSSNTKSVTLSADIAGSLSETQHLLITTLSISPSLFHCSKRDLCYAFAKYEAIQKTLKKVNIMIKDGTWKHQKPTNEEVVELFFAKSTYHKYYWATFANVYRFPEIVSWLYCEANAPKDYEIWGSQHPSIGVLTEVMKEREREAGIEEGGSGSSKKNKGKDKESGKKDKGKEREKSHKKQHK